MVPVFVLVLGLILVGVSCKKQVFFAGDDAVIRLTADSLSIELNGTVRISIQGYNSDGSYLWDGTRVDLTIENGTLDRTYVELEDGTASVVATANMERGEMKISARSGNTVAEPDPLIINVGTIPEVSHIVASFNPPVLPYTGGRTEIIVTVYDSYLQPIPGIRVILEADAGVLDSRGTPLTTDQSGRVIDYLQTDRECTVTIYAGDQTHTASVVLEEAPDPNIDPVANFSYSPLNPTAIEEVYFNATASYDADGSISSYNWDFGDGSTGHGVRTTHQFDVSPFTSKTYTVVLTVYDNDGGHSATSREITVTEK